MFNSYHAYTLGPKEYLDKIFTHLPCNAFIHKGRCGIGGTTLELKNETRCSIIVAPTVGILIDKKKSNPNLFIVYADVSMEDVQKQLAKHESAQKIMTTPEGLKKIIDAADQLGMLNQLHNDWFLLLDECHSYITEDYRLGILKPFDYFWDFKHKAIISATPYFFTDDKFKQLDYHEVKFTDSIGTITLVDCHSVLGVLDHIIKVSEDQQGNLHIFLNSVTEIVLAIRRAGLTDCNIFCANDKDGENMRKLGEFCKHYVEQPDKSNFKKVNFYTSRYFEGWDLFDDDATIVLVTDIHSPHTKVSVGMKLKQAAGRLRKDNPQIIHLTNHHHSYGVPKQLRDFTDEYYNDAKFMLKQYEEYRLYRISQGLKPKENTDLSRYADFECKGGIAKLNSMKLDQQINQAHSNEAYNNMLLIKAEWENAYYDVILKQSNIKLETTTTMKRKSKAQQLKEDYLTILTYKQSCGFYLNTTPDEQIKMTNPLAYQASKLLDQSTMERCEYNVKKVTTEVILASNAQQERKLLQLLAMEFKQGDRFTIDEIKIKLQTIYIIVDLRDPGTGKLVTANANDLETKGWYDINPCKENRGKPKLENGFRILRPRFSIRVAA
jgi:hypothetical protein